MFYHIVWIHTVLFCSLWVSEPPTLDAWKANCPSFNFGWGGVHMPGFEPDNLFFMRAVDAETGALACEEPLFHHLGSTPCPGLMPLDDYLLQIVWRDAETFVCSAYTDTPPNPATACSPELYPPDAVLAVRGPWQIPEPPPPAVLILPPRTDYTTPIATADELEHLSYWLRWYDLGDPLEWQNQWDEQIQAASSVTGVPPAILKAVIGQESQFWPMWTGDAGEVGLIQLTFDGADNALRYSPDLYARTCPLAIWTIYCQRGYDQLAGWQKERLQATLISDLKLEGPPLDRVEQVSYDLLTYARILAAYYSYSAALEAEGWDFALAAYNAGGSCILTGTICPEGQSYLGKVMR